MSSTADHIAKAATLLVLGLGAASSQGASVSYVMDQSNSLADGTAYLQVTISDGLAGAIDFTVRVLEPLLEVAGDPFGLQRFALNLAPGTDAEAANVIGLPDGWHATDGGRLDGFGLFDISIKGNGSDRVEQLTFSITGVDADTVSDYVSLSTGHVDDGHVYFAAKVHGLDLANSASQASFGGIVETSVVPAPAAIWLFGSGLVLAARYGRGRRLNYT